MLDEGQIADLQGKASSGDAEAKEILTGLGRDQAPAKTTDATTEESATTQTPETETKTTEEATASTEDKEAAKGASEVESGRDRDGSNRKPSKLQDISRLRRERRELREQIEAQKAEFTRKIADLEARFKTAAPGNTETTESDELTKLLMNPKGYLAESGKPLLEQTRTLVLEELSKMQAAQKMIAEKSEAVKLLGTNKIDLDQDEDEIFKVMEEEFGFTDDEVTGLLRAAPLRTARMIERAWKKTHVISPEKKADKAAAASGASGGLPTPGTKPSLKELNDAYRNAKTPEEAEKIFKQIESYVSKAA